MLITHLLSHRAIFVQPESSLFQWGNVFLNGCITIENAFRWEKSPHLHLPFRVVNDRVVNDAWIVQYMWRQSLQLAVAAY